MCKENCNCGSNDEVVEAIRRKIERMTEAALDRLEKACEQNKVDVTGKIAEINKKLFDGISKEDLVASIVNGNDELSLEGLLAREDVQAAIKDSEKLMVDSFTNTFETGSKIHACEMAINELAQELMDDVIIFGNSEEVKHRVKFFDRAVNDILSAVE